MNVWRCQSLLAVRGCKWTRRVYCAAIGVRRGGVVEQEERVMGLQCVYTNRVAAQGQKGVFFLVTGMCGGSRVDEGWRRPNRGFGALDLS